MPTILSVIELKRSFKGRLKTQERAYNQLRIYYTPRFYSKLVKKFPSLKALHDDVYDHLLTKIKINLTEGETIQLENITQLKINGDCTVLVCLTGENVWRKVEMNIPSPNFRFITIDHRPSFYDQIEQLKDSGGIPCLEDLTQLISRGIWLSKEAMRKEYARVLSLITVEEAEGILKEVSQIASNTNLLLLPARLNFVQGRN